jgi:hypothetical protein
MKIERVPVIGNEKSRYAFSHEGNLIAHIERISSNRWYIRKTNGIVGVVSSKARAVRTLARSIGIDIPYEYKRRTQTMLPVKREHPAGRFENETNDCTVCALANATPLTYSEAHALLKQEGRVDRDGFRFGPWMRKIARLDSFNGLKFTCVFDWINCDKPDLAICCGKFQRRFTINQFIKSNPSGNYIIIVKRHTFAVSDGTIIDAVRNGARKNIEQIFKVESI